MQPFQEKFKKLSISNFVELSLIAPIRYENYIVQNTILPNTSMVIDATVENIQRTPKTLQIKLFAHNLGFHIQAVFFKPKNYLLHQFELYSRLYLYGSIDCKSGICSIHHPKKISPTLIGEVTPIYKTAIRSDIFRKFLKENLTLENLKKEALKDEIIQNIFDIHFPKTPKSKLDDKDIYTLKYLEIFNYLKQLANKRKYFPSMTNQVNDITSWIDTLPFRLTKEQLKAIEDIKNDMLKDVSAKRMIVGDVGSGKTMVILASALMNYPNKSILMAPTTILAKQLYEEALKFLPSLHVKLVTNKTKKEDLENYDFIIGTHALLYRELPSASLVMVDEQHRFGTKQRNLLSKLVESQDKKPHFLQFSATPIPRTQAMIESSHIDVSLITSTPFKKDITTKVITKKDFKDLLLHVKNEISQNHQVLIIYPLVEESEAINYQSIDEARSYWEKNFKNVYVTHGKDKEKEQILEEFRDKGDILIATTVVEVGISLPRLSTVIIVGAERLGLSTLHQLRGRVSRTGLKGWCFLYTNQEKPKRLEEFCNTTNGFDIANMDLRYRQSGDLLKGDTQSGKSFKYFNLATDEKIIKEVKTDLAVFT